MQSDAWNAVPCTEVHLVRGWTTEAANLVADGDIQGAIDELEKVLRRLDGDTSPPDWLEDSTKKDELRQAVELLIALLQLDL